MKVRLLTGIVALLGTLAFAGAPATASFSQCGTDRVCLWGNNDYDWLLLTRTAGGGVQGAMPWWGRSTAWIHGRTGRPQTPAATTTRMAPATVRPLLGGSSNPNVPVLNSDEVSGTATNGAC